MRHIHTTRCLERRGCRYFLSYAEWIRLAAEMPDQDDTWRFHERQARENRRREDPAYVDLGGEA